MPEYPTTKLDRAVDRAVRAENDDPQGLPADILADMESDILANPDKYPALTAALARIDQRKNTN